MALFGAKISFFLRYAHITHIFGLRRTRINGTITSPYPEVTLGTFGFPVYARLAAWWAVFWPQLPKMALFGAINSCWLRRTGWSTLEHSGGPKRLQEVQVEVFDPVWSGGEVPQILAQ